MIVQWIMGAATMVVMAAAFGRTPPAVDAVVAADGSGQYRSVQEAINAAPQETSATRRWIIAVGPGTYHELLYVQREKRFVMLVGDDPATTIVTYGLSFVFSRGWISGAEGVQTYLGRPWRPSAQTLFIDTEMSEVVRPEGWHNWDKPERESTARYGESGSKGPGGKIDRRVAWANRAVPRGVRTVTVTTVLGGADCWTPATIPAHPSRVRALDAPLPNPPAAK